jgi:hypothetical protein
MAAALIAFARARSARKSPARRRLLRPWSIASNLCANSTASPITTIPKPPAWMRRSKPSTLSRRTLDHPGRQGQGQRLHGPARSIARQSPRRVADRRGRIQNRQHLGDDVCRFCLRNARGRRRQSLRVGSARRHSVARRPPAPASISSTSYEHRGRVFKELVNAGGGKTRSGATAQIGLAAVWTVLAMVTPVW